MNNLIATFHLLPYPLRVFFASAHGFRLSALRYTWSTNQSVVEALDRETWATDKWQHWQEEHLAQMLWYASRNVPYYRQSWENRRRHGDTSSIEYLQNWPILSKEILRSQPKSFIADGVNKHFQIEEHTSGTTGKPLTIWMSKEAVRQWYALFEARWRNWYGFSRNDRWGIFGGQLVTSFARSKPPFWVWNAGMHQLYFSSYHLAPNNISAYLKAIRHHRLIYLLGYASSLYSLANLALEQNFSLPVLKAVISNAEPLYEHQRGIISKAFQCPVYDTYGLSENVCAASECLHGNLHLWPEVGVTEILDDDKAIPVSIGETGRLVCTGFLNPTMPLIRYDIGDRGFLSKETACPCGRTLPILGGIEGRKDDVLLTKDGRRIGRLDPVFKADLPIREAQIIQESLESITVRYVPGIDCREKDINSLVKRLEERLGKVAVTLQQVDEIPRSANGKFRAVISKIQ